MLDLRTSTSGSNLLARLRLVNFRSFSDFTVTFGDGAYLVGPNNAGKSTILTAIRTADVLVRFAYRRKPNIRCQHDGRSVIAYPLTLTEFPALAESVRHEFHHDREARFELTWKSGARLVAVWPAQLGDEFPQDYFYLEKQPGLLVRDIPAAKLTFPLLGVIPVLTPIEHSEGLRDNNYVKSSVATRLSSRHFRNQLRLMDEDGNFRTFSEYAAKWLDGFEISSFGHHFTDNGMILDVYYREADSKVPKELVWAGDGIQIWLQILYHIFRTRDRDTLILDEPEVYLHPDLQRKLVNVLEDTGRQVIMATHSSEIVAEADPTFVTLVEKTRRRARRTDETSDLELLAKALGTAFNLRLARALRSNVVLFAEGKDMTILRILARTLDLNALASDRSVTVIALEQYSRWSQVGTFGLLCRSLLPEATKIFVVLDHDYRPDEVSNRVEIDFLMQGINAHVWRRKEIESYLLTSSVVARLSGASSDHVESMFDGICNSMEALVFGQMLSAQIELQSSSGRNVSIITAEFKEEFDDKWNDPSSRLYFCPAKDIIADLNIALREGGYRSVSVRALAREHRAHEIPSEMVALLRRVEESV